MARTHRAHLSLNRLKKRGGRISHEEKERYNGKSHKQIRGNDRARLRKEYL